MSRVIGIDLGTTNSCVSIIDGGKPVVIPNTGGYKTSPSMFAISLDGKRLVGHLAKRQAITNAVNTVSSSKRLIGRRFDSPELKRSAEYFPYKIVRGENDDARIEIAEKTFTRFISRTMIPAISEQVKVLSAISMRASSFSPRTILYGKYSAARLSSGESKRRPINRFDDDTVLTAFVIA